MSTSQAEVAPVPLVEREINVPVVEIAALVALEDRRIAGEETSARRNPPSNRRMLTRAPRRPVTQSHGGIVA